MGVIVNNLAAWLQRNGILFASHLIGTGLMMQVLKLASSENEPLIIGAAVVIGVTGAIWMHRAAKRYQAIIGGYTAKGFDEDPRN